MGAHKYSVPANNLEEPRGVCNTVYQGYQLHDCTQKTSAGEIKGVSRHSAPRPELAVAGGHSEERARGGVQLARGIGHPRVCRGPDHIGEEYGAARPWGGWRCVAVFVVVI